MYNDGMIYENDDTHITLASSCSITDFEPIKLTLWLYNTGQWKLLVTFTGNVEYRKELTFKQVYILAYCFRYRPRLYLKVVKQTLGPNGQTRLNLTSYVTFLLFIDLRGKSIKSHTTRDACTSIYRHCAAKYSRTNMLHCGLWLLKQKLWVF